MTHEPNKPAPLPGHCTVALMNDSFPPLIDGVANAVTNYARCLTEAGERAMVVTPHYPGADDSGYPFPVVRYPSIDVRKLVGYMAGYPFSPVVARRMLEEDVGLIHTHCPIASTLLARSLRGSLNVPLVMTYHTKFDIDIAKAVRSKLLQEGAVRTVVQNVAACDEVWTVSRGAGENLRSMGYEGDWIVMENGVDMPLGKAPQADIDAAAAGYDLPAGVPVLLFVGRLMWYKGIRIILDALATLRAQGIDFRMVIVGKGTDEGEIRAYTEQQGLGDRCFFTGAIQERAMIRAWYSRADLFLFPSTFDTNGLVVREAAASGLGSVLIENSCAAEGVTDGVNGFLIQENAASMAALLARLCAAPEAMRQVGAAAQRDLYLSWADAVARARERYAIVLDRYRSGYYARRETLTEDFFRGQGELMEAMARAEERGRSAMEAAEERRRSAMETVEHITAPIRGVWDDVVDAIEESGEAYDVYDLQRNGWQNMDWYL